MLTSTSQSIDIESATRIYFQRHTRHLNGASIGLHHAIVLLQTGVCSVHAGQQRAGAVWKEAVMPVYINQALKLLKVPLFLVLLVHLAVTVFSGCSTLNVTRGDQPAKQPEIFIITPTYARPAQLADLTR